MGGIKYPQCDLCSESAPNSVIKIPNGMTQVVVIHLCNTCYKMWKEQEELSRRKEVSPSERVVEKQESVFKVESEKGDR
jgi:ribosome-binding protein aMBF1 (putative translation factor)